MVSLRREARCLVRGVRQKKTAMRGRFECSRTETANSINTKEKFGGRGRDRTGDPLLAKQVLSQLSYTPTVGVTFILKHFHRFQNPFFPIFVSPQANLYSRVLTESGVRRRK